MGYESAAARAQTLAVGNGATDNRLDGESQEVFDVLTSILAQIAKSANILMAGSLRKLLTDNAVKDHTKEAFPYIYTAGFLALTGREINEVNITKILAAVGMNSNLKVAGIFARNNIKNNVIYLYTIYYLAVIGKEVNEWEVLKIVRMMGIDGDVDEIKRIIELYKSGTL